MPTAVSSSLSAAHDLDPAHGAKLREAVERGVEAFAWTPAVEPDSLAVLAPVPVYLDLRLTPNQPR